MDWVLIAMVAAVVIAVLAYGDIRVATRSLLGLEGISVTLIVILMGIIVVTLIGGSGPKGQTITLDAFKLPGGTSLSAVASASVFGFLSFAGFEGAASLGEETTNPRREIPRAIRTAVIASGIFYILCILVQTWGFGANATGAKAFAGSTAPLGDVAQSYAGSGMSEAISIGATVSAFASGLGAATAGARILFALGRDTPLVPSSVVRRRGPARRQVRSPSCSLGEFRCGRVVPILGIAVLGYTLYENVQGVPFPFSRFPLVVGIWLVIGLAIVLVSPGLSRRIGASLAREAEAEQPSS